MPNKRSIFYKKSSNYDDFVDYGCDNKIKK